MLTIKHEKSAEGGTLSGPLLFYIFSEKEIMVSRKSE